MTIGIYCIENLVNGKRYIGKSVNIERRLKAHKNMMLRQVCPTSCNRYLHSAGLKYGITNFHFGLIEIFPYLDEIRLSERELYWQDWYSSHNREFGYNLLRQSAGIITHSDETKLLLSEINKGREIGEVTRTKISEANKGNTHCLGRRMSEETKLKLSIVNSGNKYCVGRTCSDTTREKISSKTKGLKVPSERLARTTETRSRYSYEQYSLTGVLLKVYARFSDLKASGFVHQNVHAACIGVTKTCSGFKWKKIPKIKIIEDI